MLAAVVILRSLSVYFHQTWGFLISKMLQLLAETVISADTVLKSKNQGLLHFAQRKVKRA
jgi:hypothetical protein